MAENIYLEQYEVVATSLGLKQLGLEIDPGDATESTLNYKAQNGQLLTFIPTDKVDEKISDAIAVAGSGVFALATSQSEFEALMESPSVINIWCQFVSISSNLSLTIISSKNVYSNGIDGFLKGNIVSISLTHNYPTSGATTDISVRYYCNVGSFADGDFTIVADGDYIGNTFDYRLELTRIFHDLSSVYSISLSALGEMGGKIFFEINDDESTQADGTISLWSGQNITAKLTKKTTVYESFNDLQVDDLTFIQPVWEQTSGLSPMVKSMMRSAQPVAWYALSATLTSDIETGLCFGAYTSDSSVTEWRASTSTSPSRLVLTEGGQLEFYSGTLGVNDDVTWTLNMRINANGGVFFPNKKSGITQVAAGAAAGEDWIDTSAGNVVKVGV